MEDYQAPIGHRGYGLLFCYCFALF